MAAKWIWYPDEFEVYHAWVLHTRREQYGAHYPVMWTMPLPYPQVEFSKSFHAEEDFSFRVRHTGRGFVRLDGSHPMPLDKTVHCPAGDHSVRICIEAAGSLPSIFIDSPYLQTDGSFFVLRGSEKGDSLQSAHCHPALGAEDSPLRFPFAYRDLTPVSTEEVADGILYDFGEETFGPVSLFGVAHPVGVFYGESREEALAGENECCVWEWVTEDKELAPRAFRFLYVRGVAQVRAREEYLDLQKKGYFRTEDARVEEVYRVCARTFHLCSREFFLDGIKRDRWVWSGDVRQSLLINAYLFGDPDIARRSILCLLPKDKVFSHVNTITDYTMYLPVMLWEHYMLHSDAEFVCRVWERLCLLMDFLHRRLDPETGFLVERAGDWVFIDWADFDMGGPLAAEQILLWHAWGAMARLAAVAGQRGEVFQERQERLRAEILSHFMDEEKGVFVDTYTTGRRHISRHAHIFAILFDFVDDATKAHFYKNVLKNDEVPPITTPYFKLYELEALCQMGDLVSAQDLIESYWGKMLDMGATTMWEQFDPAVPVPEAYAMYGGAYQKSLCHAWSAGPIYFLGRYAMGVSPTSPGWETYRVEPCLGKYKEFEGAVPTPRGNIYVTCREGEITVLSPISGGTLSVGGKEIAIPMGLPTTAKL